ncbi:MAG: diaminopimelate decarboxylase [Clostridium sp.]
MKLFGNMKVDANELLIGGIKASYLSKEYGTPLYVMDEGLIRQNCKDYFNNFKCKQRNNRVAYAGKAFLTLAMCKIVKEEGLYLDVVSGGELFTAYKAGFDLNKVYFHGNNKTVEEIDLGIKLGVGNFIVDNLYEMEVINNIAKGLKKVQNIYLRLTPGIEAHTHEYIKTGQIDSKFGFAPVENIIMDAVKQAISYDNICLKGLHCHIGSQIFDLEPYADAAEIMLGFIKDIKDETGYEITELDLGGGFGIYYTDEDAPKPTNRYCEVILEKVDEVCEKLNITKPILTIEPGRSIVGNAGTTLYTIGAVKEIPEVRKYVAVDGGMTDNIRPSLYKAKYDCGIIDNVIDNNNELVTIAGKCCESGDILIENILLPKVKTGDVLAITTTGAYGYSMSSNYNKNPRPAVVMVNEGEARIICKRQSFEDLISNELI